MSIYEKLAQIQVELKAPKNQYNSFGKYKYRSCEDILEAAKPLAVAKGAVVTISDEVVEVASRVYVKATATITDLTDGSSTSVSALAREAEEKKGMDAAQVTGAASSYARKYALGGLFCLDDVADSDATNTHGKTKAQGVAEKAQAAGIAEQAKEYKCCDCGKDFAGFTDKTGKVWNAGQVYHMSESKNIDGKARCSECMKKAGTEKKKG